MGSLATNMHILLIACGRDVPLYYLHDRIRRILLLRLADDD